MRLLSLLCCLYTSALVAGCSGSSNYFQNDGPPGRISRALSFTSDNVTVKVEQPHKWANRPYTVMGKRYYPITGDKPMVQTGTASWYGKQFHGKKTAIGEKYDMFAMTAAHPTMELPSYAKVTNLKNGRSVIVRVNDRGPFLHGRVIDMSYAAAVKLGYDKQGITRVKVERITRRDIAEGKIPPTTSTGVTVAATAPVEKTTSQTKAAPSSVIVAAAPATSRNSISSSRTSEPRIYDSAPSAYVAESSVVSSAATASPETAVAAAQTSDPIASIAAEENDIMRSVVLGTEQEPEAAAIISIPVESIETTEAPATVAESTEGTSFVPRSEPVPAPKTPALETVAQPAVAVGPWSVQIGAYGVQVNAESAAAHAEMMLAQYGAPKAKALEVGNVWRVYVGGFEDKTAAMKYAQTVSEVLGLNAFAVAP